MSIFAFPELMTCWCLHACTFESKHWFHCV